MASAVKEGKVFFIIMLNTFIPMKFIKTKDSQTGEEVQLHYCEYGSGRPVVLIHGWPSSMEMWEYQIDALVSNGFRVIKYDRRGFGKSSKPWGGYDYDSLAADLKAVLDELDLENAVLVGFSMGGGEVARYFGRYGATRVSKAVLVGSILPYMLKTNDNPDGVPKEVFEDMANKIKEDRIAFLDGFGKDFFGVNLINHPVSGPYLDYFRMLASVAPQRSTLECAKSFSSTDFRNDVPKISVPTLIIHGDADKIVPIAVSSDKTAKMVPNNRYLRYEGASHGLFKTHADQLNADIIKFINE